MENALIFLPVLCLSARTRDFYSIISNLLPFSEVSDHFATSLSNTPHGQPGKVKWKTGEMYPSSQSIQNHLFQIYIWSWLAISSVDSPFLRGSNILNVTHQALHDLIHTLLSCRVGWAAEVNRFKNIYNDSNTKEVYFSLTQKPKQTLQGGWQFSWGTQGPSILGLHLPVGPHHHLHPTGQLRKKCGRRTAPPLGLGAPHFLYIPLVPPNCKGSWRMQSCVPPEQEDKGFGVSS